MKAFPTIIAKLSEPLLITPQKYHAICQVIEAHLAGNMKAMEDDEPPSDEPELKQVNRTAIVPVHGVIGKHLERMASAAPGCDLSDLDAMIDMVNFDASVNRVIFDFRTPGGTVTGIPETARKIASMDKETIAFTDSQCCSGGLWLAAQCQKFYSTGSASIGSVGVWCAYLDLSQQMADEGVKMQAFSAGEYKLLGAYWEPMSKEEKAIVQKQVVRIYEQFLAAMGTHRQVSADNFGNGLVFDGEQAAELGFSDGVCDDIGDILDAMVE